MLCQYTVTNYKSIKDEATLNLEAANISEHKESLLISEDGEKYLPLSVIYGPNGGGKSNLIKSFISLVDIIRRPYFLIKNKKNYEDNKNGLFDIEPFALNEYSKDLPTSFDIYLRNKKYEYHYNCSIKNKEFVEEYLSRKIITGDKYSELFVRDKESIQLRGILKKYNNTNLEKLSESISLISYLMILNEEDKNVRDIFNIFVAYIITIDNSTLSEGYLTSVLNLYEQRDFDKSTHNAFLQMFSGMNLNIFDYEIREENNHKKIYTTHKIDDINYSLKISQESEGAKKVVSLIPLMHACLELGGVLVVDELDSKLHPKLLAYIMDLFRDKTTNKRNAQLIFTSHDLMTMDSKYLRRDEIWFIGKNSKEESQLYSLIEFKKENGLQPRKDESYNKQYFEGRYGSDPYLKKIIEWK